MVRLEVTLVTIVVVGLEVRLLVLRLEVRLEVRLVTTVVVRLDVG